MSISNAGIAPEFGIRACLGAMNHRPNSLEWRLALPCYGPRPPQLTLSLDKRNMALNTRILGKSGIAVTEMGLGLWAAGGTDWGPTDDRQVLNAIELALELGVNFFDTADIYGDGHSEELLGQAMQGRRERFVVATKIGWRDFDGAARRTAYSDVNSLIAGVESNLRRLQTDYIDVIQSHISFRDPTMEIFIEGFRRLEQAGKVRAYGVSTSDFEYLQAFNHQGGCATLQIDYSILNRTPEAAILDYCQRNQIGVIVRGALAMGLLAGKFDETTSFSAGDFRQKWLSDPDQNAVFKQDLIQVRNLSDLARDGRTLAQTALKFTLLHPAVTTVIPGVKTSEQVRANLAALSAPALSQADRALIDRVTPPGGGRKIWPA
jgi:aryl-alcohol dehydrogenase-like predicted oxidoreductase